MSIVSIAKFFEPLGWLLPSVLPAKFLCSNCGLSNAGMMKFLTNFLIVGPITINDFHVSMLLAFRAGFLTDLILYLSWVF